MEGLVPLYLLFKTQAHHSRQTNHIHLLGVGLTLDGSAQRSGPTESVVSPPHRHIYEGDSLMENHSSQLVTSIKGK